MRVRVSYTIEATDEYRRAIRFHFGREGYATRTEVREWLELHGSQDDDDILYELAQYKWSRRANKAARHREEV